ncbi:MAG: cobyrinic acid a,c-diamide synthase, partial [Actinomycetota bacterium]|nr:cobyrinic acid a,c-diamide synthase [Actinomycetota bacterium]
VALARSAPPLRSPAWVPPKTRTEPARVAVAGGPAFSFGYAENLELLQAAGAELVALDPTRDPALPDVDALYLGGGFPEAHADALGANVTLRTAVAGFAAAGRPILAECGGLLYLCRSLDGKPMCGVLEANAVMTDRLTLGYRRATVVTASAAWQPGAQVCGHEFHYSTVEPAAGATPAWQLVGSAPTRDARGAALTRGRLEGFVAGGLHASYLHTHWAGTPQVAAGFVAAAARARVHQ